MVESAGDSASVVRCGGALSANGFFFSTEASRGLCTMLARSAFSSASSSAAFRAAASFASRAASAAFSACAASHAARFAARESLPC